MGSRGDDERELHLFPPGDIPCATFVLSSVLAKHRASGALLRKLYYARRYFPELKGKIIKIGFTRSASGMAVPGGRELWFNPASISYHTIAHELIHLLQGKNGIPQGERSCDLFSLARDWTLNDTVPHYVSIPPFFHDKNGKIPPRYSKLLYSLAVLALKRRRECMRNYISFFEKTLRDFEKNRRGCMLLSLGSEFAFERS